VGHDVSGSIERGVLVELYILWSIGCCENVK
jgi:hypothetical protein